MFTAFDAARGDVLMILDADLTMPPEQLPKFWEAIRSGKGEFVNGSRLVYPMEDEAMRFLNLIANKMFSLLFTWLLSQRFTDTLVRHQGAAPLRLCAAQGRPQPISATSIRSGISISSSAPRSSNLKVVEIPIRYANRTYGETQISRFRHGLMLLRMVLFAFLRIKAL